jgi:hypothetical protein
LIAAWLQGSNVLVHYLGLHADDPPPLTAAISMSNAYDLIYGGLLEWLHLVATVVVVAGAECVFYGCTFSAVHHEEGSL